MSRAADPTVAAITSHVATIRAALRAAGVAAPDMPDMEQEVALRAWLQLRGAEAGDGLASLLWVIAWRTGRHFVTRRDARGWRLAEPLEEAEHEGADPVGRLEARDELRLLARLDPRERRIVQSLADGATFAELAVRLRVPPGTASTWVRALRRSLRRKK